MGSGKVDGGADDLVAAARQKGNRADLWGLLAWAELKRQRTAAADTARKELTRLAPAALSGWHREQASAAEDLDEPFLVVWHLSHLLAGMARSAESGKLLRQRGEALASLSRWKEAADNLDRAAALPRETKVSAIGRPSSWWRQATWPATDASVWLS